VFNSGYMMAGSITVVTAIHLALLGIEEFLNFPRNSLARDRHSLSWLRPSPSGERSTPSVLRLTDGDTRSIWCLELSARFVITRGWGVGRSVHWVFLFLQFMTGANAK
jgi:hypothetical protein